MLDQKYTILCLNIWGGKILDPHSQVLEDEVSDHLPLYAEFSFKK